LLSIFASDHEQRREDRRATARVRTYAVAVINDDIDTDGWIVGFGIGNFANQISGDYEAFVFLAMASRAGADAVVGRRVASSSKGIVESALERDGSCTVTA
jgi:hypothetical protein